jgi:hypothetical protein
MIDVWFIKVFDVVVENEKTHAYHQEEYRVARLVF